MSTTPSPEEADRSARSDDAVDHDVPDTRRVGSGGQPPARPPLRRSTDDRVIAGVAGGIGRYLGVDPVLVRIALVVLAVSGGAGVLLYIIAWIVIPEARPGELPEAGTQADRSNGAIILGAVLLIAGGLLLADRVVPTLASFVGPIVLIALGGAVILGARR